MTESQELHELREAIAGLREEIEGRWMRSGAPPADEDPEGAVGAARGEREAPGVLDGLAAEIRARASEVDWLGLFNELRRRFAGFGIAEGGTEIDDFGLDPAYLEQRRGWLDFLFERWWRIETAGTELIPSGERLLFVSNRSGVLPYDGLMIAHAVERAAGAESRPRFLVADWLLGVPFSAGLLSRLGGVRACAENAERLLRTGRHVIAFPEGQKGALKPFSDRYQLQRFARGGFVSIAVRERATIVPVAVVGAEEVHPILFQSSFAERLLGVPLPVTPTFPWLGPLGLVPLPSRWRIRFGAPIRFADVPPECAADPLYVNRTREIVRGTVRTLLEQEVRGRSSVF
ncbi:MAG: acyltransferase family protein [Deltaproteobacteria bacterium]|nr:acyltransferase family protein [Deltaproteobacteria bacterium]